MPDENDTSEQTEQLSEEVTSLVNADGTFVKDWTTKLKDETLHNDPTLIRFKGIEELSSGHVNVRRQVPMDKMPRPTDHFTDTDWEDFHKAGGKPDTAGDYNIQRDEKIPEAAMTKQMIEGYEELFHKIGLSKKQSDAIVAYNSEQMITQLTTMAQKSEMDFNTLKDGLTKKWGLAFEQNTHLGNIAIDKGAIKGADGKVDLDAKERLIEKINKDPDLIEFASNLGSLFAEHKIVEDINIPSIGDMDTKIREAQNHPAYMDKRNPDHARQVQIVAHLIQEKTKHQKKSA
ncbi:hypothetical protein LCGC14_0376870 [marine sediment metagenome]|uniref:Uncharacterized protein n=1 Tax=marine sediment metagenome TaxID=412755 RepID=A0A0F9VQS8_9ZZZZ